MSLIHSLIRIDISIFLKNLLKGAEKNRALDDTRTRWQALLASLFIQFFCSIGARSTQLNCMRTQIQLREIQFKLPFLSNCLLAQKLAAPRDLQGNKKAQISWPPMAVNCLAGSSLLFVFPAQLEAQQQQQQFLLRLFQALDWQFQVEKVRRQ